MLTALGSALATTIFDPATGDSDGQLTWDFALANADAQFLAEGQTLTAVYRIAVQDPFLGVATQDVTINITGSNDAPVITGGAMTGAVQEEGTLSATGTSTAIDVDDGTTLTWSVSGGVSIVPSDFEIGIDQLKITKGASVVFEDNFSDGAPPPSLSKRRHSVSNSYSVNGPSWRARRRAVLEYALGVPGEPSAPPIRASLGAPRC